MFPSQDWIIVRLSQLWQSRSPLSRLGMEPSSEQQEVQGSPLGILLGKVYLHEKDRGDLGRRPFSYTLSVSCLWSYHGRVWCLELLKPSCKHEKAKRTTEMPTQNPDIILIPEQPFSRVLAESESRVWLWWATFTRAFLLLITQHILTDTVTIAVLGYKVSINCV